MNRILYLIFFGVSSIIYAEDFIIKTTPLNNAEILIDGITNESAWQNAAQTKPFQRVLSNTTELKNNTSIRVLYDKDALYISTEAELDKGVIPKVASSPWEGERIEFVLKPEPDEISYFLFSVSAAGGLREDGWFGSADCEKPLEFTCDWQSAVHIYDNKWTMEVRIPYSSIMLEKIPEKGQLWKCNFCRGNGNGNVIYSALNPKFSGFHYSGCNLIFE